MCVGCFFFRPRAIGDCIDKDLDTFPFSWLCVIDMLNDMSLYIPIATTQGCHIYLHAPFCPLSHSASVTRDKKKIEVSSFPFSSVVIM